MECDEETYACGRACHLIVRFVPIKVLSVELALGLEVVVGRNEQRGLVSTSQCHLNHLPVQSRHRLNIIRAYIYSFKISK